MVRLEERKDTREAHKVLCANECYYELDQKEKQIGRILVIAEKDKREAMHSLDQIKKLCDQLHALSQDFKECSHLSLDIDSFMDVNFSDIAIPEHSQLNQHEYFGMERRRSSLPVVHLSVTGPLAADKRPRHNQTLHHTNETTHHTNRTLHHASETFHPDNSPVTNHSLSPVTNHSLSPITNHSLSPITNHSLSPCQSDHPVMTQGATSNSQGQSPPNSKSNHVPQLSSIEAEQLIKKEAELQRVTARAKLEAARATFLQRKKEELQRRLLVEVNERKRYIKETKQSIERKEKEISRLSFLAEQDKKIGMFLCQQIAQLKKSLEGFLQAREESKPETLCNILVRCSSSSDLLKSPPASPVHSTSSPSHFPMHMRTVIGKETEAVVMEDQKKSQELSRVKFIVEQESKQVDYLKAKVEELKEGLVAELQQADEQLGKNMQEFMQKQLAIEKVTARAERERARSYFLKDEIVKLTTTLKEGKDTYAKKKGKSDEYGPDVAYLSAFSELPELSDAGNVQPSEKEVTAALTQSAPAIIRAESTTLATSANLHGGDGDHATSLPLSIAGRRARDDPSMYIFSPPCRAIPISPASECIYVQKLKDIAVLKRETSKKEEELVRLKKLAEAERCRHLLLKDKFEQLRTEMREREAYACTL